MKRIIALAAAVAVLTVFARVADPQGFEAGFDKAAFFSGYSEIQDEDASEPVSYDNDEPDFDAPYDFADFGSKYLSLDTGDATLWRTNTVEGDVYFDMAMQFNPSAAAPDLGDEIGNASERVKIAVFQNADSNIVVMSSLDSGATLTNFVTTTSVEPGTWHRLTISARKVEANSLAKLMFKVYVDKTAVQADRRRSAKRRFRLGGPPDWRGRLQRHRRARRLRGPHDRPVPRGRGRRGVDRRRKLFHA